MRWGRHWLCAGLRPPERSAASPAHATDVYSLACSFCALRGPGVRRSRSLPYSSATAGRRWCRQPVAVRPSRNRCERRVTTPIGWPAATGDLTPRPSCLVRGRRPVTPYGADTQDLEHHRRRYPIAARERTAPYVAGRFVQRHLTALGVAAALAAAVIGGVAAVLWQAAQATEARARAERRFADVRDLAGSFMFEVYDAEGVPPAPPARELIVQKASSTWKSLARSRRRHRPPQELARAFVRVGTCRPTPLATSAMPPARCALGRRW